MVLWWCCSRNRSLTKESGTSMHEACYYDIKILITAHYVAGGKILALNHPSAFEILATFPWREPRQWSAIVVISFSERHCMQKKRCFVFFHLSGNGCNKQMQFSSTMECLDFEWRSQWGVPGWDSVPMLLLGIVSWNVLFDIRETWINLMVW